MQEYRLVTCRSGGERHETPQSTAIDTILTEVLRPKLVSDKSISCPDRHDISVRNRREGLHNQRYSAAVDDYRCMEELIQDVALR
jgi:hypothetical protein